MPTYQYECTKCSHSFEQFQLISAKPIAECPQCGGSVRRLIGAGAGILFKGSGFYKTDYRSPSYQKKAEAEKKSNAPEKKVDSNCKPSETKTAPSSPRP